MNSNLINFNRRDLLKKLRQVSLVYTKIKSQDSRNKSLNKLKYSIIRLVKQLKNIASIKQIKMALGSAALFLLCSGTNLNAQTFEAPKAMPRVPLEGFTLPELVDWDNDGDLDVTGLVYGNGFNGPTSFYIENTGNATDFKIENLETETIQIPYREYTFFTESGDIDSDGDADIVQISLSEDYYTAEVSFFINEGGMLDTSQTVTIGLQYPQQVIFMTDPSLVDYDKDGDLDIMSTGLDVAVYATTGEYLVSLFYFENIGDGTLSGLDFAAPIRNPDQFPGVNISENELESYFFQNELADFDNDGDLDLVVSFFTQYQAILLYSENIDGVYTEAKQMDAIEGFTGYLFLTTGDIDGDGDIDIAFDNAYYGSSSQYGATNFFWMENTTIFSSIHSVEPLEGEFRILGNPAKDNIILSYTFEKQHNDAQLHIIDMQGQRIHTEEITEQQFSGQQRIDVSSLSSGTYSLVVYADGKTKSLKFMVQ